MKIGVFGNCQSVGMSDSFRTLVPHAEVHMWTMGLAIHADLATRASHMEKFSQCDVVFFQPTLKGQLQGLTTEDFVANCKNTVHYPQIACNALHPDCHYIWDKTPKAIQGPMGPYQSAIVVAAFKLGLSEERAIKLFNAFVYEMLSYTRTDFAGEPIVMDAALLGYDFDQFIEGRRGVFMHTVNHPTIDIIYETALQSLAKAEIPVQQGGPYPADHLRRDFVWPIYPRVATLFGHGDDELRFLAKEKPVSLRDFVFDSYRAFHKVEGSFSSPLSDAARRFVETHVLH